MNEDKKVNTNKKARVTENKMVRISADVYDVYEFILDLINA